MRSSRAAILNVLGYSGAMAAATFSVFRALVWSAGLSGPILLMALAAALWISAMICRGLLPSPSGRATAVRGTTSAIIAMFGVWSLLGPGDWSMHISLVTWITMVAVGLDLSVSLAGGHARAGTITLGAFVLLAAAPLWSGPYLTTSGAVLDAVIWSNPFVHLSVLAQIDLFRTDLLYGVSPIGDLRYTYPSPKITLPLVFGVVLALNTVLRYTWKIH